MNNDLSKFIQCVILIVGLYFYLRGLNIKNKKVPRLKMLDTIFSKYYELYFFKFRSLRSYPKLLEIYKDMAIECHNQGIDIETVKLGVEVLNTDNKNILFSFISGFIVFMGATQLTGFLNTVKEVSSFLGTNDSSLGYILNGFIEYIFENNIHIALLIIIIIVPIVFLVRIDNRKNVIKYSKDSQMKYIIKDFSNYYENQFDNENEPKTLIVTEDTRNLFNIKITKFTNGFNIYIPAELAKNGKYNKYTFENNVNEKKIRLFWKNNEEYEFTFKKLNNWKLEKVSCLNEKNGSDISQEEFQKLEIIFEILFEEAREEYLSADKFSLKMSDLINNINKETNNKYYKFFLLVLLFLIIFLFTSVLIVTIFIIVYFDWFYIFFLAYLCYQISSWLLKKVH